ncbi:MAG: ATP-dependent helicase HrpB [Pseudomonadota bacterium]
MLPIDAVLPQLDAALKAGPRAILVAPPGAGKTTRVPLALLQAPWRGDGRIIVLEPRRLAARAAARFMARQMREEVGETVGYRMRLEAKVSPRSRIIVVTEGVFARMIAQDPGLEGIAAVVFDEFHERSLDADLALALALDSQAALRPDLRLLVMSATLDVARVATLMAGAPVIQSQGRAFPVETRYLGRDPRTPIETQMAAAIERALRQETGSVLAFLPGQREIRRTAERLAERLDDPEIIIAPLYGALDSAAQDRAIAPAPQPKRKVVLASAIAETALTIEGVRVVVDSGLARVPRYAPASGLTRLVTQRVTGAAADQRRGRAGRTGPGVCYRLWDEAETRALIPHARPEICDADLTALALALADWGVADVAALRWLDPPPAPALAQARALLKELEAVDENGHITPQGRALTALPLHPRLAHMLHAAARHGAGDMATRIAVLLGEARLGGRAVDLVQRLENFAADRSARAVAARRLAARWQRGLPPATARQGLSPGAVLSLAYPERIALARPGQPGRFLLASGGGAWLPQTDALAAAPMLAVGALSGGGEEARILLAATITMAEVSALHGARIDTEDMVALDPASGEARARRRRRLGALILAEQPFTPAPEAVMAVLDEALAARGIASLPWPLEAAQLRARLAFAQRFMGGDWPDLSDAALAGDKPWRAMLLAGKRGLSDITPEALNAALEARLDGRQRKALDDGAPSHFITPAGARRRIDYGAPGGPAVAVRVQELYGLDRHPMLAKGRVALNLILLSPAGRPLQITGDLPGFWRGSYGAVKKAMKGRYPKHFWPDEPATASPRQGVRRPRGR